MPDPERTIVVTGVGAITPSGNDAASTWEGLAAGRNEIRPITQYDPTNTVGKLAAEVRGFDPVALLGPKRTRRTARFSQLAVGAAREAATHAGLEVTEENSGRIGVVVNNAVGGCAPSEDAVRTMVAEGAQAVSPFFVPSMITSVPACDVAIDLGAHGPVNASALACASGTAALVEARRLILSGEADVVVAGGTDAPVCESLMAGLGNMGPVTPSTDAEHASRPFDVDRDGFVPGEGAVVFVLESAAHAAARGAEALVVVAGGALTADAFHLSAPEREGRYAGEAMRLALERAGVAPEDLGYVAAHGTSTRANDTTESKAIRRALGDATDTTPVSSPKSMVGHLMGGAGALSALVCMNAIRQGIVPPTINLDEPDPECPLDHVANVAREVPVHSAMANAFGFGGQNGVVVLTAV